MCAFFPSEFQFCSLSFSYLVSSHFGPGESQWTFSLTSPLDSTLNKYKCIFCITVSNSCCILHKILIILFACPLKDVRSAMTFVRYILQCFLNVNICCISDSQEVSVVASHCLPSCVLVLIAGLVVYMDRQLSTLLI